jgi:hypothetical protein
MTEARLKANRENAKKAALSGRSGRPRGSMDGDKLSLRERCRVRDEEHVRILEAIAADSTHPGFQVLTLDVLSPIAPAMPPLIAISRRARNTLVTRFLHG